MRFCVALFSLFIFANPRLEAAAFPTALAELQKARGKLELAKKAEEERKKYVWQVMRTALEYKDYGGEAATLAVQLLRDLLAQVREQNNIIVGMAQMVLNQCEKVADFKTRNEARQLVDPVAARALEEYVNQVANVYAQGVRLATHSQLIEETESQLKVAIDIYLTRAITNNERSRSQNEPGQEEAQTQSQSLTRMYAEMAEECYNLILALQEYKGRRRSCAGSKVWICEKLTSRQKTIEALLSGKEIPPSANFSSRISITDDHGDDTSEIGSSTAANLTLPDFSEEDDSWDEEGGEWSDDDAEGTTISLPPLTKSNKTSNLCILEKTMPER